MKETAIYKLMNETLGAEVTVKDLVAALKPEQVEEVKIFSKKELRNFEKKRASMYDKLVRVLSNSKESVLHDALKFIADAKIFNFEEPRGIHCSEDDESAIVQAAADVLPSDISSLTSVQFQIPFPKTALVFPDAILVLFAVKDRPNFYCFTALTTVELAPGKPIDILQLGLLGWSEAELKEGKLKAKTQHAFVVRANEKAYRDLNLEEGLLNWLVQVPFVHLAKLNTLDRFILEVSPLTTSIRSKKYIPRSHQRPEYILLHPSEIRRYLRTEHEVIGHKRAGHERRGHLRTLRSDYYKHKQGTTLWIDAVWIGSTEAVVGDRKYKVILN